MIEVKGDLFAPPKPVEAICITTNGEWTKLGVAVMGRGVALEARQRWPGIAKILGRRLQEHGNVPMLLTTTATKPDGTRGARLDDQSAWLPYHLITLPTKYHWRELASVALIKRSLAAVRAIGEINDFVQVALPRPGCANGGLDWPHIGPVVAELLPGARWLVIHKD